MEDVKVVKFLDNGNVLVSHENRGIELEVWFRPIASVIDEAKVVLKRVLDEEEKG